MTTMARAARLTTLLVLLATQAAAVEWSEFEGSARGYPVLRDLTGKKLADGDFSQWLEGGRLHVKISYNGRGRHIEENTILRQSPQLMQDWWSLREVRNGKLYRLYEVNFASGTATGRKQEKELRQWSEKIDIDRGRAFAGFGFTIAVKALRKRLVSGEHVELQAVGFSPKPRVVNVDVFYSGRDRVPMSGRILTGDHFVVHPKLPWIADLFVDVPDAQIWLTSPPAGFLRFEGPLAEPGDPIARIDLLPAGPSEQATPISTGGRAKPGTAVGTAGRK